MNANNPHHVQEDQLDPLGVIDDAVQTPQQSEIMQVPQNNNDHVETTQLFKKSATHFNVTNSILLLYSASKLVGVGVLLSLMSYWSGCMIDGEARRFGDLERWACWIAGHSVISIFYYCVLVSWMSRDRNRNLIAVKLGETVQQHGNDRVFRGLEESKRISILSMQIKYEVQKANCCGKLIGRVCFITFQILFVWGMILFFQYYSRDNTLGCQNWLFNFLIVILFLGIYQYIDFYLITVLVVLCSPFLLVFLIYYLCSFCQKQRENQQVMEALGTIKYQPCAVEGDPQCSICYTAYELEEELIVLKCSKIHHFHAQCIKAWLRVQKTCPLCRAEVGIALDQENQ